MRARDSSLPFLACREGAHALALKPLDSARQGRFNGNSRLGSVNSSAFSAFNCTFDLQSRARAQRGPGRQRARSTAGGNGGPPGTNKRPARHALGSPHTTNGQKVPACRRRNAFDVDASNTNHLFVCLTPLPPAVRSYRSTRACFRMGSQRLARQRQRRGLRNNPLAFAVSGNDDRRRPTAGGSLCCHVLARRSRSKPVGDGSSRSKSLGSS